MLIRTLKSSPSRHVKLVAQQRAVNESLKSYGLMETKKGESLQVFWKFSPKQVVLWTFKRKRRVLASASATQANATADR